MFKIPQIKFGVKEKVVNCIENNSLLFIGFIINYINGCRFKLLLY